MEMTFLILYLLLLILVIKTLYDRAESKSFRFIAKRYKEDLLVDSDLAINSALQYDEVRRTRIAAYLNGIKSNHIVPDIIYKRNNVYIRIAGQWVRV